MKNKKTFVKINRVTTMFVCCILFCFACFIGTFFFMPERSVMAINWSTQPSDFSFSTTGDGSVANPYKISTAEQLATVSKNIATYKTKSFKLIRNLDISKYNWVPIGTATNQYSGTFDGDNFSISGIRIDAGEGYIHAGLFGRLSGATIKNLTMVDEINTYVVAKGNTTISYAGAVAGYAVNSRFDNVLNFNVDVYSLSKTSTSYAGGIVGLANSSTFNRVVNMGNVNSVTGSASNDAFAGGIVAYCYNGQLIYTRNDGKINSIYSKSLDNINILSVYGSSPNEPIPSDTFTTKTYAGGICGYDELSALSFSYNTNNIKSGVDTGYLSVAGDRNYSSSLPTASYAGGIVGYTNNEITNVYNLGNVTSNAITTSNNYDTSYYGYAYINELDVAGQWWGPYYWKDYFSFYINTDLTNKYVEDVTTYKVEKNLAYAGGIAGYSQYSITSAYNDGAVSGGKETKTQKYVISLKMTEEREFVKTPFYRIFYSTVSWTNRLYFSAIKGNRSANDLTNTYGNYDYFDYTRSVVLNCYEGGDSLSAGTKQISLQEGNLIGYSSLPDWRYSSQERFNNSLKRNSTGKNITLNNTFLFSFYKKEFAFPEYNNPSTETIQVSLTSTSTNQQKNYTTITSTSISVLNLGSDWSKVSGINGNRPYITNFYW